MTSDATGQPVGPTAARAGAAGHPLDPVGEAAGVRSRRRPEGRLRAPRQDPAARPFLVIWEATQACPLACRHCRAEARPERDPGELTTAEAIDLMRQVAAFGKPAPLFVITGGDPFQRPDLYDLVARGSELGLAVSVSPSGTPTLTRSALRRLRDAGARAISLSLDAASADRHDGFRGVDGVFRWTLDAWGHALSLGLKVQINTTVSQETVADLPLLADLVHARGALLWSLFPLVPTGRGRALGALSAADLEDVLNALYDVGATIPVKTTEGHHFKRIWLQRHILAARGESPTEVLGLGPRYTELHERMGRLGLLGGQRTRRAPMRVSAANGFVFVSHRGAVRPSGFLPVTAGNVRESVAAGPTGWAAGLARSCASGVPSDASHPAVFQPDASHPDMSHPDMSLTTGDQRTAAERTALVRIYRTAPLFTGLRDPDQLRGRCGRCEFRWVCGGSRARAYASTGDPLAEDPACGYQPGSFPFPADLEPMTSGFSR